MAATEFSRAKAVAGAPDWLMILQGHTIKIERIYTTQTYIDITIILGIP
jgi:hypothetical protein